jgi:N,N'-diacetyllegionaminate synthase
MRPIIIAECCQNHNGDKEILKKMIHAAATNGADYVKIQSIRSHELTHRERFDEGLVSNNETKVIKRPFRPELERLSKLDLDKEVEKWFVEECWSAGVAPLTTAFTRTAAREIKGLGFEAIKVASYDCASYPLLRELRREWNTLFVSTGATFDAEIEQAAKILEGTNFSFLHCVTMYPTPMEELHLRRISYLRKFTSRVGYSDHSRLETTGLWASKIALALGADCIERHFTILKPDETRDGPVSIDPGQLKELRAFADLDRHQRMELIVKQYPNWQASLGNANRTLSAVELLNRDYYRGRFASRVGDKFVYNWEETEI